MTPDEERELRDRLVRLVILPVDSLCITHVADLARMTSAARTRFIVESAIGALIANDLIRENPEAGEADGSQVISFSLPEHLYPAVSRTGSAQ